MDVVGRELDVGRADEDVIYVMLVGGSVEVEGHAVRGVACVTEASFERAVFHDASHLDCDTFNGVTDGKDISHTEFTFNDETQGEGDWQSGKYSCLRDWLSITPLKVCLFATKVERARSSVVLIVKMAAGFDFLHSVYCFLAFSDSSTSIIN